MGFKVFDDDDNDDLTHDANNLFLYCESLEDEGKTVKNCGKFDSHHFHVGFRDSEMMEFKSGIFIHLSNHNITWYGKQF